MHAAVECQILCGGQRHARRRDTLDRRVVGKVGEQHRAVDGTGALEFVDKELGFFKRDADGGEDDGEVALAVQNLRLSRNLRGQLRVRQTRTREDGQLLPADKGVQTVDARNAGLDELVRVVARRGVHRKAVDVAVLVGDDLGAAVDGLAHAVEDAAQHVARHGELERVAQKADTRIGEVDACRCLKQLHDRAVAVDLKHLAAARAAVGEDDLCQLVIRDALHVVHDHQRAGNFANGLIFTDHSSFSPFSAIAAICSSISTSRFA